MDPKLRKILLALLAFLATVIGTLAIEDGSLPDGSPDSATRTVVDHAIKTVPEAPPVTVVDGADSDQKVDDVIPLSPAAQDVTQDALDDPESQDFGGDLRGDDTTRAGKLTGPLAAQEWPGCRTAFVRNFSYRTAPIRAIALHYTAGPERVGWADLEGLTAFSNIRANEVSWAFSVDREGHCYYNVPLKYKAWTIGNLNSQTVNIEVVGTGREAEYAGAGFSRLGSIIRRIGRIERIPIRVGATDGNCNVTRTGVITHWMGGACSGGHVDIKPYDIAKVVAKVKAGGCAAACQKRERQREHVELHKRLRALTCAKPNRHPNACRKLRARNRELHKAGI